MDSGANHHLTNEIGNVANSTSYHGIEEILVVNGNTLPSTHIGKSRLSINNCSFVLDDILCSPQIHHNLLSVHSFT